MAHSKGPTPPRQKRRAQNKAILNLLERVDNLEKKMLEYTGIVHNQAIVIAEAVFGIQLLLKKGIITHKELSEVKKTLLHADSILSPGSSLQSKDARSDVDSVGSGEPGVSGESSDRGDIDSEAVKSELSG